MRTQLRTALLLTALLVLTACGGTGDAEDVVSEAVDAADSTEVEEAVEDLSSEAEEVLESAEAEEILDEAEDLAASTESAEDLADDAEDLADDAESLAEEELADVADGDLDVELPSEIPDFEVTDEFCSAVDSVLQTVASSGDTPEELETGFADIDAALADALAVAPEGTESTLEGVRAFFAGIDEAAAEVDYDQEQVSDEVFAELEAQYGQDVETMEVYFEACELDF